jgi:HAMP domain-containing protein
LESGIHFAKIVLWNIQKYQLKHGETIKRVESKLFIIEILTDIMTDELGKLQKTVKEYSDNLARLGKEIAEIKFNYKIIENTTEKYWEDKIVEFKKYNEKATEYYIQAHSLMNLIDKEQSGLFLLSISKLRQSGLKLLAYMGEIKKNPSTIKSKDKQQSKWSKDLREKLIESNTLCMNHEKNMNKIFRGFYEKHLKDFLKE